MAMRILAAKEAGCYVAALRHLEAARDLLLASGRAADWRALVAETRDSHHRKRAFMPGFERLVAGWRSADEPTFLESARLRWKQRMGAESEGRRDRG